MKKYKGFLMLLLSLVLVAFAIGAVPADASAAGTEGYEMYLKIDGIEGESTTKGFEKWIDLKGVQFEVKNTVSAGSSTGGAGAGKATLEGLTISKQVDSSSVPLFLNEVQGKAVKSAEIVYVRNTGKEQIRFLTIKLSQVLVADYKLVNKDETFKLQAASMELTYTNVGKDGRPSDSVKGGWDFKQNAPTSK